MLKKTPHKSMLLAAIFWLIWSGCATAQKISLYQEAGANYANIRPVEPFPYPIQNRDDIGNKASFGFEAGFVARFSTKIERLSVPVGVHFQRKGFHVKPQGPVYVIDANGNLLALLTDKVGYRFDYLTLTPTVEYRVVKDWLGLSVGPYFSFRAKEAVKIFNHTGWEDEDSDTFTEKTDFGLQAGIHVYWKRFVLFAKYQHGIRESKKFETVDENFYPTGFLGFRNRAIALGLSFQLL